MAARSAALVMENTAHLFSMTPQLIQSISSHVNGILYVPLVCENSISDFKHQLSLSSVSRCITSLYSLSSKHAVTVDLRPLLHSSSPPKEPSEKLSHAVETVFVAHSTKDPETLPVYKLILQRQPVLVPRPSIIKLDLEVDGKNEPVTEESDRKCFNGVAVGGTFDHFHNGHRLFLSQSILIARKRILIGIADGPLLVNKTLAELIEPLDKRIAAVKGFLQDVRPEVQIDVVPITDVYGPTAWDAGLDCLVITADSSKGSEAVNQERKKRGLPEMHIECVDMVAFEGGLTEMVAAKLSSTQIRQNMLGELRSPDTNRTSHWKKDGPFIIGLTGGIASGKSSVCRRLAGLGAHVIDCDKLGHAAYEPGTTAYTKVVDCFGPVIVGEDGRINRKILGPIVLKDKNEMKKLTDIVWPEIRQLSFDRISQAWKEGCKVCVLDAAVLLEAEWDRYCHEVWLCILSQKEALKRIMERDGVSQEVAERKIVAQMSSRDRMSYASVVLSTHWEPEVTQKQVEKAWSLLMERLGTCNSRSPL